MKELKISIITVTLNAKNTIDRCILSVTGQEFPNIQHIIIDGGSTDGTIEKINQFKRNIDFFISEPDLGIYDAMNKGIARATGDVVGTLNADDYLANNKVLNEVASAFAKPDIEILYGNLNYINPKGKIIRKWRTGHYKTGLFNSGWMPPHPTFYCRKELFERYGNYKLNYGSAADYELMLRFLHRDTAKVFYLDKVMVEMMIGGSSNRTVINRLKAWRFDLKAMYTHNIWFPVITLILKPLRKIIQYF